MAVSSKPCPFCGRLYTYVLRAASSREVWSPGRYCPGCNTMFDVIEPDGEQGGVFEPGELVVRRGYLEPDHALGPDEPLYEAYKEE